MTWLQRMDNKMQNIWTQVDEYFSHLWIKNNKILQDALELCEAEQLPAIHVSPHQGKMLYFFAQMSGAKHILEIGTLGGYSTLWMALALPEEGQIVTLERNLKCTKVAGENFKNSELSHKIQLMIGDATEILPTLSSDKAFDMIFIDADKQNNPFYIQEALRLSRKGTVIIVDNIVREGSVLEKDTQDIAIQGIQTFAQIVASHPRLEATAIQTVGCKGYDGFALIRVIA